MVFILSALWWIRIRGLWKLPDGREETGFRQSWIHAWRFSSVSTYLALAFLCLGVILRQTVLSRTQRWHLWLRLSALLPQWLLQKDVDPRSSCHSSWSNRDGWNLGYKPIFQLSHGQVESSGSSAHPWRHGELGRQGIGLAPVQAIGM